MVPPNVGILPYQPGKSNKNESTLNPLTEYYFLVVTVIDTVTATVIVIVLPISLQAKGDTANEVVGPVRTAVSTRSIVGSNPTYSMAITRGFFHLYLPYAAPSPSLRSSNSRQAPGYGS
jgi:hypothetical protein